MVVAIILQAITVGIMFSLAVMYAELVVVFDSNRSQVAVIQSVYSGLTTGGGKETIPKSHTCELVLQIVPVILDRFCQVIDVQEITIRFQDRDSLVSNMFIKIGWFETQII